MSMATLERAIVFEARESGGTDVFYLLQRRTMPGEMRLEIITEDGVSAAGYLATSHDSGALRVEGYIRHRCQAPAF